MYAIPRYVCYSEQKKKKTKKQNYKPHIYTVKKVRRVTNTHFLGILLDVQLSRGQHIENIKGKKHASKKHTKNPQRIWMGCPCKHHADLLKVLHQG